LVYPDVKFDATKEFSPVVLTATNPLLLVVSSQVPAKTVKEFLAWAKTQNNLNYASTGSGTMTHLPAAAFAKQFGIDAVHIPYKGAAPAMVDLASGHAQFMVPALSEALPRLRDGRIRALAITSASRSALFPEVPTIKEATGSANFEMGGWQGIFLPKGASQEVISRLNAAVNAVVKDAAVQAKFAPHGTELLGGTPDQFMQFMKAEQVRWKKIIQDAGARAE
jgi:tripartite-type tricarboxylate transporter receptor subunit TctC